MAHCDMGLFFRALGARGREKERGGGLVSYSSSVLICIVFAQTRLLAIYDEGAQVLPFDISATSLEFTWMGLTGFSHI